MSSQFVSSITGCARCDGDGHADVTWQPLTFAIEDSDGSEWTHWAPCPVNGEPILMRTGPSPSESGSSEHKTVDTRPGALHAPRPVAGPEAH